MAEPVTDTIHFATIFKHLMTLLEYIRTWLAGGKTNPPEGYCPNCWGTQEYEGEFYKAIKNEGINVNNIEQKKGWIQAYAAENLSGIRLVPSDNQLVCNSCKIAYQKQNR